MGGTLRERLSEVLESSRTLGFLGPGDVAPQIGHAEAFAGLIEAELGAPPPAFLDLGSGGGLPGLVLACRWTRSSGVLLDAGQRRCAGLREFVDRLELGGRIAVLEGRGELLAHDEAWRERFPLVVARSFGGPAVTAEIGGGFTEVGGALVVSEPPPSVGGDDDRWPADGLTLLGLSLAGVRRSPDGEASAAVLHKVHPLDPRYPRRTGIPAKRPLW